MHIYEALCDVSVHVYLVFYPFGRGRYANPFRRVAFLTREPFLYQKYTDFIERSGKHSLLHCFCRIAITSPLNVRWDSPVKPRGLSFWVDILIQFSLWEACWMPAFWELCPLRLSSGVGCMRLWFSVCREVGSHVLRSWF